MKCVDAFYYWLVISWPSDGVFSPVGCIFLQVLGRPSVSLNICAMEPLSSERFRTSRAGTFDLMLLSLCLLSGYSVRQVGKDRLMGVVFLISSFKVDYFLARSYFQRKRVLPR